MVSKTQAFYEVNANDLIERYDSADMSALHQLFHEHVPAHSKVIDIGFGSGRDLAYLRLYGHEIFGIDPIEAFVVQAQNRFKDIRDHFRLGSFLTIDFPLDWVNSFDVVISIAVWMHLTSDDHRKAIETIKTLLKTNGIVILSFSIGGRENNDGRHFEALELDNVVDIFKRKGFSLIESRYTDDSLGRESIVWVTIVLQSSH